MIMINLVKLSVRIIIGLVLLMMTSVECLSQKFPDYYNQSDYDYSQGKKGKMTVINYEGSTEPSPNKAYIFATKILKEDKVCTYDLLRLTLAGAHTFNSPYANFNVKVQLANQDNIVGTLMGANNSLYIYGQSKLCLGTNSNVTTLKMTNEGSVFGSNITYDRNAVQLTLGHISGLSMPFFGSMMESSYAIGSNQRPALIVDGSMQTVFVDINESQYRQIKHSLSDKYSLFVRKGILAEDYAIAPVSAWSDYVFNDDYRLMPLSDLKYFIKDNKHLPGIPTANDVSENGYSQHSMNAALLKKVEELTLYIIDQQKQIDELKAKIGK